MSVDLEEAERGGFRITGEASTTLPRLFDFAVVP